MQAQVLQELRQSKSTLLLKLEELNEEITDFTLHKSDESLVLYQDLMRNKALLLESIEKLDEKIDQLEKISSSNKSKLVTIEIEGVTRQISIVSPTLADSRAGYVSFESPLAKALDGKKIGETFQFVSPAGVKTCTLISIR